MPLVKFFLKILLPALLGLPVTASATPLYGLTFLPQDFEAAALNSAGQVVGTADGGAAIWSSTAGVTSLGALLPGSEGMGINSRGDIVGRSSDGAFMYAHGAVTTILPGLQSWATGINDAGQVTGTAFAYTYGLTQSAFLYADGATAFVGTTLPAQSQTFGNAVNSAGMLAGTYAYGGHWANPDRQALSWQDGVPRTYGTLGGAISEAQDINDGGALAGWSTNSEETEERALLHTAQRGMQDLGSLGGTSSRANGLNNLDWVVGISDTSAAAGFDYHAFLYRGAGMVDLNDVVAAPDGWRLVGATDVNDAGQILARACPGDGACRAVRLDLLAAIPEPAPVTLVAAGLAGLALPLLRRRRARRASAWLGLSTLALAPLAHAGERHAFTMAALPAQFSASAIDNGGRIVGTYGGAAAVWNNGAIETLASLAPGSTGAGLSDNGNLVGYWNGQAFLRTPAGIRNIGRYGFWPLSSGAAVNDAGEVAGNGSWPFGEEARGWVFTQGVMRMIGTFGGDWSEAHAINRSGHVVGTASRVRLRGPYDDTRAFLYRDRMLQDLGTIGDGLSSWGYDVNDAGQVVGAAEFAFDPDYRSATHPFLYENRLMRDLGTLGGAYGVASGINNAGAVVGQSTLTDNLTSHAFLYEHKTMRDLHRLTAMPPGWVLVDARDINDRRQVLARACGNEDCLDVRLDPAPGHRVTATSPLPGI